MSRSHRTPLLAFAGLLLLTGWALWPGLHGGFVFDDYPNLELLGGYGPIDNGATFLRYITSGFADPTGRPLSMLSFLLDARNWPTDPFPFKRTNLLLHLCNGLLLFAALRQLGRTFALDDKRRDTTAALAAGLWMLHPLFVSTTLYIVQREAMLPATFAFVALWTWLSARRRLLAGDAGAIWRMTIAVVLGTMLSTLSKANGVLLPVLLLVVECCLPEPDSATSESALQRLRTARRWLLWLPTLTLCAIVLASIPGSITSATANRSWTLGERLLTEPRVLFDYLSQLLVPRPFSRGLFNDDYLVSRSLFDPWTTLPAIVGLIALAVTAWRLRKPAPAIAMAIGFFLVGQSLESGPLALELYFEHRNYLPAALLFWPLALWLTGSGVLPRLRNVLIVVLPLLLAVETWLGASLWGDPTQQAFVWAARNPDSPRAQAYAAQYESHLGHFAQAETRLRIALGTHPLEMQLLVNLAGARCARGSLQQSDLTAMADAFEHVADPGRLSFKWLEGALPIAKAGTCAGLDFAEIERLAKAFARNPRTALLPGRKSDADHLFGEIALAEGKPDAARAAFDRAYKDEARLDSVLLQAAMLATANQPALALGHLELASVATAKPWYRWRRMGDVNQWVLYRQGYWQQQIDELRGKIEQDLVEQDLRGRHDAKP